MKPSGTATPTGAQRPALERMLQIHRLILDGGYPSAGSMAKELAVSPKTVYRDIDFMRDRLELPIAYHPQKFGLYYSEPVDSFPALQMSEGELFALLVAEKALQQYRGTPFESRLAGAFQKLAKSLPDTISVHLADWDQSISFRTTAETVLDVGVLDALSRATVKRRQITFEYRKPGSKSAETRLTDPYHLSNVNGEWYLFAYDHQRKAVRTFAPARIHGLKETGATFAKTSRFSLKNRLKDSFGVHSREGNFPVRVRIDPDMADFVREKKWHSSQELKELEDGGVELRLTLGSLLEIERWILQWGGAATALEPPELVERIEKAAARLARGHPPRPAKRGH